MRRHIKFYKALTSVVVSMSVLGANTASVLAAEDKAADIVTSVEQETDDVVYVEVINDASACGENPEPCATETQETKSDPVEDIQQYPVDIYEADDGRQEPDTPEPEVNNGIIDSNDTAVRSVTTRVS